MMIIEIAKTLVLKSITSLVKYEKIALEIASKSSVKSFLKSTSCSKGSLQGKGLGEMMGNRAWFTSCSDREEVDSLIQTVLEWEKTTGISYVIRIDKPCPLFEVGDFVVAWSDNGMLDFNDYSKMTGDAYPTTEEEVEKVRSRMQNYIFNPKTLTFPAFEPFVQKTYSLQTVLQENHEWHTDPGGPAKFGRLASLPEEIGELFENATDDVVAHLPKSIKDPYLIPPEDWSSVSEMVVDFKERLGSFVPVDFDWDYLHNAFLFYRNNTPPGTSIVDAWSKAFVNAGVGIMESRGMSVEEMAANEGSKEERESRERLFQRWSRDTEILLSMIQFEDGSAVKEVEGGQTLAYEFLEVWYPESLNGEQ